MREDGRMGEKEGAKWPIHCQAKWRASVCAKPEKQTQSPLCSQSLWETLLLCDLLLSQILQILEGLHFQNILFQWKYTLDVTF